MTRILLMGGSRFIGKHLLHQLAEDETNEILVLNRGSIPNEDYLPPNAEQISVDRNDADKMKEVLSGKSFDLIFDVSGITGEQGQILLDSLETPPKRHIHVSSGAVYDTYREETKIYWLPLDEDFPIGPINEDEHPYMRAKRGGEKVLFDAFEENNYPITIVRPTYVYGPDNYIYREAYFYDRMEHDRPVLLPNKGHAIMDLVYVEDLARLLIHVSKLPDDKVLGKAFNGTKGDMLTPNFYTNIIAKILGKEPEILYYDPEELKNMNWPQQRFLYPYGAEGGVFYSSQRIENELDFTDSVNYDEGLTKAYHWWKEHGEKKEDFRLEEALADYLRNKGEDVEQAKKDALKAVIETVNQEIKEAEEAKKEE